MQDRVKLLEALVLARRVPESGQDCGLPNRLLFARAKVRGISTWTKKIKWPAACDFRTR
jgi:hypothetical protein